MNVPKYHSGEGWYPDSEPDLSDEINTDDDVDDFYEGF